MWVGFQAYSEAMRDVLVLKGLNCWGSFEAYKDCAEHGGFRVMHEEFCIVSDFPEVIKRDAQNRPHCSDGPSHRWRDGFEIYHLNGVAVPKYLVMTPEGQLSLDFFLNEKNADVKAEFIKKYGFDRMKKLGKVVDSYSKYKDDWYKASEYELIDMADVMRSANFDAMYCPYLWMKNLTTGTYHMEGVSPECRTIEDAINFRLGKNKQAYVIGGIK
jgi:hypothetical protein